MFAAARPLRRLGLVALALGVSGSGPLATAAPPEDEATPPAPDDGAQDGTSGEVEGEPEPEPEPPPTWRFRKQDRRVKVVVLAGSVGAWPKDPYAEHFETMCKNVEVRNISKTGYGALALKKHFRTQVLENGYINLRDPDYENWVVFQGGLNSIAMPEQTNRHILGVSLLAHGRGMKVLGLTPTPWGDEADKRWKGASGLWYWKNTRVVVDFITGRSDPKSALGKYVSKREQPARPDWHPSELPDVGIDLYASSLRDLEAAPRDYAAMEKAIAADARFEKATAGFSELGRAMSLHFWAFAASLMPRWYLRSELRAFDHIHPNTEGHALIAQLACPQLPESWGCTCPDPG